MTVCNTLHPRHAQLVAGIEEYLEDADKSARWLGLTVANDARLVPNLRRGQAYPTGVLLAVSQRMAAFYERRLAADSAARLAMTAYAEQRLAT